MEIHAHVPKLGKTPVHWLLEGLFIVVSVLLAFAVGEFREARTNRELTARVLQVTDIYDALTTDRPYRKALPLDKALSIMREEAKRGWWDGSLIDQLELLVRESALQLADVGAKNER